MSRRAGRVLLGLVIGALVGGAMLLNGPDVRSDRRVSRAEQLHRLALDAAVRFEWAQVHELLLAALRADSAYLPALLDLFRQPLNWTHSAPLRRVIDSIADSQSDSGLAACLRAMSASTTGRIPEIGLSTYPSIQARHCAAVDSMLWNTTTREPAARAAIAQTLCLRYPLSAVICRRAAESLAQIGAWQGLLVVAEDMMANGAHPLLYAQGLGMRAMALHGLGRDDEALVAERDGLALARAFPGVYLEWLEVLLIEPAYLRRGDSLPERLRRHLDEVAKWSAAEIQATAAGADRFTRMRWAAHLATSLLDEGDLLASVAAWDRLLAEAEALEAPDLRAEVQVRRGRALVKLGRTAQAEQDLLAGREWARRAGHVSWGLEAEHNLLHLYEAERRWAAAEQAGVAFVAAAKRAGLPQLRMMSHHDLGWLLWRTGKLDQAALHLDAMVREVDGLGTHHYWAGEYTERIGDLDRALASYRSAAATETDAGERTRALAGAARVAEAIGDVALALRYARQHDEAIYRRYPENTPLLPGLLARIGRMAEGLHALERARAEARARGQEAAFATLSREWAELALRKGDAVRAAVAAEAAAVAADRVGAEETALRARAIAALAHLRVNPGDVGALEALREVARRASTLRLPSLNTKIALLEGEGLFRLGLFTESLAAYERAAMHADREAASLATDPAQAGYRGAQVAISNGALEVIVRNAGAGWAAERFAAWSARRKGRGIHQDLRGRLSPRTLGHLLSAVRASLQPDEAVVDYVVLDTLVAALVVTDRGAWVRPLPTDAAALGDRIRRLRARLTPRLGDAIDLSHTSFDADVASDLHESLIAPIDPLLEGRTRLILVPDGPLHLLPFDALVRRGEGTAPQFLVERYALSLAPSLLGVEAVDVRLGPGAVLVVAPEGETEAPAVAGAFGDRQVRRLTGAEATEARVLEAAPDAAVIHLATHAQPNDVDPAFAYLRLTPVAGSDGRLHAHELETLKLRGTIVVLSACETAGGRLAGGEGVLSLGRAFLRAGASATVATLWPVGSPTAEFMQAFYGELARGVPAAGALRSAKLKLLHGRHASPLYWAAFVIVGRPNPPPPAPPATRSVTF